MIFTVFIYKVLFHQYVVDLHVSVDEFVVVVCGVLHEMVQDGVFLVFSLKVKQLKNMIVVVVVVKVYCYRASGKAYTSNTLCANGTRHKTGIWRATQ